jgi:hypothetical protein
MCRAAGFLCVPAFNMDETPQDMADFVGYVNGPADSAWGRKRVEDGHAEPYALRYLELGNEEQVDESYWRRFEPMAKAIWAADPAITIVVGDFAYGKPIADPFHFNGSPAIHTLAAHQKILELARANGRPVWFDVHVGNDEPDQPDLTGTRDFIAALGKLVPGAEYKVCIFEENAGNHAVRRGLGHAHAINAVERLGANIPILCAANCLQPDKQNDNDWDQGMLFLSPSKVWGQPPYYVTQMFSRNYLPLCVKADCDHAALDVTAKASESRNTVTIQVVNMKRPAVAAEIDLGAFGPKKAEMQIFELTGDLQATNTQEAPETIVPRMRTAPLTVANQRFSYEFPGNSFTILRLE